jgi:hypothetical protein
MSENVVLNRSNITSKDNNKLTYNFPSVVKFEEGDQLAISHMNVYYSWYNVSQKYNNNKFNYIWWDSTGALTNNVQIIIPDGFYSVATMFEFIQSQMVKQLHYLTTDPSIGGDYVYFIELLTNITYYGIEFRLSSLSEQYVNDNGLLYPAGSNWIAPPDTVVGGVTTANYETPQIVIPSNNTFGELLGFDPQTIFVDTAVFGQFSVLNDNPPNMNPSSSFIVTCNLIDNSLGIPNDILYSFTIPNNVNFGDLITSNTDVIYSKVKPGSYSQMKLSIMDQDFNNLRILDPNVLIVLSVVRKHVVDET